MLYLARSHTISSDRATLGDAALDQGSAAPPRNCGVVGPLGVHGTPTATCRASVSGGGRCPSRAWRSGGQVMPVARGERVECAMWRVLGIWGRGVALLVMGAASAAAQQPAPAGSGAGTLSAQ